MLLLLKPEAHGKRNEVTFNLTPDMIVQVTCWHLCCFLASVSAFSLS